MTIPLLLWTLTAPVWAGTLAEARAAERTGSWNEAAALYEALAEEGSGPALRRLAWLEARRDADGDWDGLEALDAARRGGGEAPARSVLGDEQLSPLVRHEAALWLAGQALDAGDAEAALAGTEHPWAERAGLPRPVLGQAVRLRATALAELGRYTEARAVEAELAVQTTAVRPSETDRAERVARNSAMALGSAGTALVLVLGLLPAAWRGWRRPPWPRPWGLVPLLLLLGGTAALVELREAGSARWWALLSVAAVSVHLLSAGAARNRGTVGQVVVGTAAALATLALAFVVLWATESLDQVGL